LTWNPPLHGGVVAEAMQKVVHGSADVAGVSVHHIHYAMLVPTEALAVIDMVPVPLLPDLEYARDQADLPAMPGAPPSPTSTQAQPRRAIGRSCLMVRGVALRAASRTPRTCSLTAGPRSQRWR